MVRVSTQADSSQRGLSARRQHQKTFTTKREPDARVAPNLLDQDLTASRQSGEVDRRYDGHLDLMSGGSRLSVVLICSRGG
jgi:hypothetical protein